VPGGWEVNDFIQAAVRKALDGTRKWHPEEQDLLSFMKGIISSEVSSRATAIENANDRRATTLPAEADVHTVDVSSRQDESLSSAPSVVEYAQWRNLLLAKLEDPLERAIVTLVIDEDLDQPQEIADRLQVSVDEVYNAKKRLRRKRPQLEQT
jgi:DNA-directed RNA polymerase specialized sigma24 family protein